MSATFSISRVEAVVKQGWRRRFLVLAVDQSALVLALLFGGLSLLLVLGTQILAWQWLLALAAVGTTLGVFGVRRQLADTYQVAQMMDRHLSLNDWLSTAWFLKANQVDKEPAAVYQLTRAEEVAQTADPARAFPFERRRSWVLVAGLSILALGLFSARYLVTQELSLRRAFLPPGLLQVFENLRHGGSTDRQNQRDAADYQDKSLPPGLSGQDSDRAGQPPKTDPGRKAEPGASNAKGGQGTAQNTEPGKSGDGQEGEKSNSSEGSSPSGSKSETAKGDANAGDKQDSKQDDATGPQHSSSLVDRMRDALSSVMAKIKPTGSQNSQSSTQKNSDGSKNPDQAGNKDQNDTGQKDAGKEQSAQEQSAGEQQGQGTAKAQASQGKDSAQPSDKKGSDAQSGVGHADGDKEVKAAEQAKAMGKLAEIIGKRSASLTGEMQIEPSGKQRLQTGYTHQQGQHADLGGEINRDEVPVEDQEYVREYMELVRKKPARQTR